jgi:predicted acyl esterase
LTFKTESLREDLTLAGPLTADLWVATTGSASDWVVKLVDVYPGARPDDPQDDRASDDGEAEPYPGGRQMLIRAEVMRGRFRDGFELPKPFTPGEVTPVKINLQDILHTFKRGHRVMIQIQSTWFPFVDRNPQKFVPNIFEATTDDFVTVFNRVYRSGNHPSCIHVGVLP